MIYFESILITIGALFILTAGIGLARMPDFFARLQATSKASTVGVLFILIGVNLSQPSWEGLIKSVIIALALLLTTPAATQALAKAAWQNKTNSPGRR